MVQPNSPPPVAPAAATAQIPKQHHTLTLSSAGVFIASVLTQVIGLIASIALAKTIGLTVAGQFLLGTVQLFLIIGTSINGVGDLRVGSAYTFFLARGKPAEDNTGTYLVVRLVMVAVIGVFLILIGPLGIAGHTLVSGTQEYEVFAVFVTLPILWSFSTVYNQYWIGAGNSLRAQLPLLLESSLRTPILIYVAFRDPTIWGLTGAYAVGAIASTAFSLPTVISHTRGFSSREAAYLFRYAWPLMGGLALNYLATNAIPLIVSGYLGAVQLNIFLYANGFRILALSLPTAVTTPLFPYLSGLHKREEYEAVRAGTWRALRFTSMLLIPGVLALIVYRVNILYILANGRYLPAATPLAILAASAIPFSLGQIILTSLTAIGRQRLELYITGFQVGVLFTAAFVLLSPVGSGIFNDGLIAASVAVLLSSVGAFAANVYFMEKLMAVRIQVRSIAGIGASALAGFLVVSRLNTLISVNRYYQLALGVLLGYAAYFLVLAAVGELTKRDVRQIGRSMGLPNTLLSGFARLCWRPAAPELAPADLSKAPGLRQVEFPETFSGAREMPDIDATLATGSPEEHPPPPPE